MTDESRIMGLPSNLHELLAERSTEPFAELLERLDASNGYTKADLAAWRAEHDVTASLQTLWAQCGDPRLLLLVRGLSAHTDAAENAWRRIAVSLCAAARALAPALPPGEPRPLRVLEAAEAWTRGACAVAHLRETYDANCDGFVVSEGYDPPTIYHGYDQAFDVATGPLEEMAPDARVHRVALRLLLEHGITCVDAIADHEGGPPSLPAVETERPPPAALAMGSAAATAYFAHFLDLVPASRQAPQRDRRRAVAAAAGTMMGGLELTRSAPFYAARARLADALRAQVRCPMVEDVLGRLR